MNNRIVWTEFAILELQNIYYYHKINASAQVAERIKKSILESVTNLQKHYQMGQLEENLISLEKQHRYIVEQNYKIIYYHESKTIFITDIFDCRQNPQKMMQKVLK